MLINALWFGGGVFAGVVATITAMAVRKCIKAKCAGAGVNKVLTMERVSSRAADYLSKHPEVDEIAVTAYGADNMPAEVAAAVKGKLPEEVQNILVLVAIKNNEPKKTIAVFLSQELEPALRVSLEDGIFSIGR